MTGFLDFPASGFESGVQFWKAVTGSSVSEPRGSFGEFATLLPSVGDPYLRVQRVENGPGGIHLDLHADNVKDTSGRAQALGATIVGVRPNVDVLHSPAGVTFCVVRHRGKRHRPPPTTWNETSRSLVDQVSVDVGPTKFPEEAAFWSDLTGWERRTGALPEFEYLMRPACMPFRLLLQKLSKDDSGGGRLHLDLASDDVTQETRRHVVLGASVIRTTRYWTTLVDPAGLTYCVTARNPETGVL